MPALPWSPQAFLEILGVEPDVEEHGVAYRYRATKPPLRLEGTVWPYKSDVAIRIFHDEVAQPSICLTLVGCSGVRGVRDRRGECGEFGAANLFTRRYDGESPMPYGVRLRTIPTFSLEAFRYRV